MGAQAERDAVRAREDGKDRLGSYYEGWSDGLLTFAEYVRDAVKPSCFPPGSCSCHPLLR
jgi:hypothetical protein